MASRWEDMAPTVGMIGVVEKPIMLGGRAISEPIVPFGEKAMKSELRELVRQTVEDTLNGLLEEEADGLVGAERYERAAYRAGHCGRRLVTASGEVMVRMPKLKGMRFTTAIIERCRCREIPVEEAMTEMRLAGASTRRIEDVSEALWGESAPFSLIALQNTRYRNTEPLKMLHSEMEVLRTHEVETTYITDAQTFAYIRNLYPIRAVRRDLISYKCQIRS